LERDFCPYPNLAAESFTATLGGGFFGCILERVLEHGLAMMPLGFRIIPVRLAAGCPALLPIPWLEPHARPDETDRYRTRRAIALLEHKDLVLSRMAGTKDRPTFWVPFLYRDALDMIQGPAD